MKTTRLVFVLVLALPSCRQTGNAPVTAAESSVEPSRPSEFDNWQRTKDCAARVDAMQFEKTGSTMQRGRVAHYSRKYDRCFMKVTDTLSGQLRSYERRNSVMLTDAFEGSLDAMLSFVGPCYLGGKQEDCAKVEAFIDDAMEK
jgi:hypothetical protein